MEALADMIWIGQVGARRRSPDIGGFAEEAQLRGRRGMSEEIAGLGHLPSVSLGCATSMADTLPIRCSHGKASAVCDPRPREE